MFLSLFNKTFMGLDIGSEFCKCVAFNHHYLGSKQHYTHIFKTPKAVFDNHRLIHPEYCLAFITEFVEQYNLKLHTIAVAISQNQSLLSQIEAPLKKGASLQGPLKGAPLRARLEGAPLQGPLSGAPPQGPLKGVPLQGPFKWSPLFRVL